MLVAAQPRRESRKPQNFKGAGIKPRQEAHRMTRRPTADGRRHAWYRFPAMAPVNLVGKTVAEIAELLAPFAQPPFRARQIYAGIYRRRLRDWDCFTDIPRGLRERLGERFVLGYPRPRAVFVSRDGTRRYLLEVGRGDRIEAVFIPEPERDTICVSTQVGCAVGCLFCVSGRVPLRRNLSAGEIAGQVLALQSEHGCARRRLNVVIMGMGEPLYNYDNVVRALRLMTDPEGMAIPPRRITLSTAGVVPQLERLAREPVVPNLAISLNATTDEVRDRLMPINRRWNIAAILETCRRLPLEPRRRITFEYVLVAGVNDSPEDARRLVRLLAGLRKKVNLIPLNADPSVPFAPPSAKRVLEFQSILAAGRVTTRVRKPRGKDIGAACGMLAVREKTGDAPLLRPAPEKR